MVLRALLFILAGSLFSPLASAGNPKAIRLLIGPEFEFSRRASRTAGDLNGAVSVDRVALEKMLVTVRAKCAKSRGCKELPQGDEHEGAPVYRFELVPGFIVHYFRDPACVEITSWPKTIAEFERLKPVVEKFIYQSAFESGLNITSEEHNHIHMGFEASFMSQDASGAALVNYQLFRNLLVDLQNHIELAQGVWLNDSNAQPMSLNKKRVFTKVLDKFDKKFAESPTAVPLMDFCKFIGAYRQDVIGTSYSAYYTAVKLRRVCLMNGKELKWPVDGWTLEFRANVARKDFAEWLMIPKLFEARINYLNKKKEFIPLVKEKAPSEWGYKILVARHYRFVTESGMDWKAYRKLMPRFLQVIDVCRALLAAP